MLVAVVTTRDVTVVTLAWLLGLAHGIGAALDRQVIRRLRCWPRLFGTLRATLSLSATVLLLLGAIKMRVLWTRLIVFGPWLIVLRLRARLVILRARLFVTLPTTLRPSFMLTARFRALLFSHHLRADGDHQQTNTCHTPDALHAIPHCGLGLEHETGKASPGSETGYQSREQFS